MRKFWIAFHRISGLILLVPLLLQSISGTIIVFDHAIDEWLNPELVITTPPTSPPASLADILSAAMHAMPDISYIASLRAPRHERAMYTAFVEMKASSPLYGKRMELMIHPYTAEVVSVREWGTYFTSMVYLFHFTFLLGPDMELVIGFLAILMFVNVVVGVYYGWPRHRKVWNWLLARNNKVTPTIGKLRRTHILAGLIALPVFPILIVSGISLIFPDQTNWLFNRPNKPQPDVVWQTGDVIQPDVWLLQARKHWPDKQWQRIIPPTLDKPVVEIRLNSQNDPRKTSGSFALWLNPQTGQILAEQNYNTFTFRQKIAFWLFPLHSGEAFGLPGRLLVFISGLLSAILALAGGALWIKRKFRPQKTFT